MSIFEVKLICIQHTSMNGLMHKNIHTCKYTQSQHAPRTACTLSYIYIYIYIRVYVHVFIYHIYIYIRVYVHIYIYPLTIYICSFYFADVLSHTHTYMYIHMNSDIHKKFLYMHITYFLVLIHIHIYICIYTYICTHRNTQTDPVDAKTSGHVQGEIPDH